MNKEDTLAETQARTHVEIHMWANTLKETQTQTRTCQRNPRIHAWSDTQTFAHNYARTHGAEEIAPKQRYAYVLRNRDTSAVNHTTMQREEVVHIQWQRCRHAPGHVHSHEEVHTHRMEDMQTDNSHANIGQ
jgi:hypothetical protein